MIEEVLRIFFEFHIALLDQFNSDRRIALQLVKVDQGPRALPFRYELQYNLYMVIDLGSLGLLDGHVLLTEEEVILHVVAVIPCTIIR